MAKGPSWGRWLLGGLLVLAVVLFYALGLDRYLSWRSVRANLDGLQAWAGERPVEAVLLYAAAYTAVTALSLPVAAGLSLLSGALFGLALGVVVVSFSSTLGASLAFLSSRYLFRDWVRRRLGHRLEAIDRGVERDGAYYLFTLRLVPAFPFFVINLALGLTPMRLRTFWWVSQLGMLPATVVYVYAGRQLGNIESPGDVFSWPVLLSLALLGVTPLLLRWGLRLFRGPKGS
jgi:uncharacterized membrane protein YdjX (TVP38/TMEM64 family)